MTVPEISPSALRCIADMHAVYRMSDETGTLLYIGRTGDAGRRFGDHSMKRWFPLVATITLEWHPTEAAAVLAERDAIWREGPRYNVAETPRSSARTSADPLRKRRPRASRHPRPGVRISALPVTPPEMTRSIRAELLSFLGSRDGTTITTVAVGMGVTFWTARTWLSRLRDEGAANVCGTGRGARWHLTSGGDGS